MPNRHTANLRRHPGRKPTMTESLRVTITGSDRDDILSQAQSIGREWFDSDVRVTLEDVEVESMRDGAWNIVRTRFTAEARIEGLIP